MKHDNNQSVTTKGTHQQVVVLGFDALDVDLVMKWASEGVLPRFAALLDRAACGRIQNDIGNIAGTVWQTFHTGVWPGKHGYYEGVKHFDPETYDDGVYFADRKDVPREQIWEVLSRNGHRVAVLDAPYILLPEDLNGLIIDGWGTHQRSPRGGNRFDFATVPTALRGEVLSRYGEDPLGIHESACDALKPRNAKEVVWFRDALIRRVETKARMTIDFLKRERWAYFEVNFPSAHCVGHQCWHYHDQEHPRFSAEATRALGDPVQDVYAALDRALGQVLDAVDADSTVIVWCSHGMGPLYTATGGLLDNILFRLENIKSPQRTERAITAARNVWRRAPGPLRRLLLPLAPRRFDAALQKRIQPAKSGRRFFQQYMNGATGGIRINLEGRESRGRVKPGDEYDALCRSLTQDLLQIVNADSGAPLIRRVFRSSEIYEGPFVERMPDLLLEWNRERPITRVSSPKIGTVVDPEPSVLRGRSGDHRPEGWFAALRPGLPAGEIERPVATVDFAPTIAGLLGANDVDFDGSPIAPLMRTPMPVLR